MSIKLSSVKFLNNIKDNYLSKKTKKRGRLKFNKENLNSWMKLTKSERFNLSKKESLDYLAERKNLLNQIRNEYKNTIQKK